MFSLQDKGGGKTQNGMEWNRLFHFVLFQIFLPKTIMYSNLDPKNLNLGIPNPKPEFLRKEPGNYEAFHFAPFCFDIYHPKHLPNPVAILTTSLL